MQLSPDFHRFLCKGNGFGNVLNISGYVTDVKAFPAIAPGGYVFEPAADVGKSGGKTVHLGLDTQGPDRIHSNILEPFGQIIQSFCLAHGQHGYAVNNFFPCPFHSNDQRMKNMHCSDPCL